MAHAQPAPGPEHDLLKKFAGAWTAKVKMGEEVSTATVNSKMELGGMWLVSSFSGNFGEMKFEGHGMDSYDAAKKKYVSVWVDSMSAQPMLMEGTYDKEKKILTMTGEGAGPEGKAKYKTITRFVDDDHHKFTMYMIDGGEENEIMTIEYARKK